MCVCLKYRGVCVRVCVGCQGVCACVCVCVCVSICNEIAQSWSSGSVLDLDTNTKLFSVWINACNGSAPQAAIHTQRLAACTSVYGQLEGWDDTDSRVAMQIRILDFMALSMGVVAAVRPASSLLQPLRPPRSLCTQRNYVLVCETMLIACIVVVGCTRLLESQSWYTGGTSHANHVSLPIVFAQMPGRYMCACITTAWSMHVCSMHPCVECEPCC